MPVPNRGHSETGDEGTHHLQLLLHHAGDGMGQTGTPCPRRTGSLCHLVLLKVGLAPADHKEEFSEHEDEWLC